MAADAEFANLNVNDEDSSEKSEVRPPRQKDVVGLEDLIVRLTKRSEYLDVVSPIGMFGVGKRTLAWKIFNHPAIHYHFPIRIWLPISISQELSLKDIFLLILKEFTGITDDIRRQHEHQLAKMVSAKLETSLSFFLIVMDDSPADWDRLRDALPDKKNAKVLITSGIEEPPLPLISLSYDKLPYHLRPCFLYFGIFPQDFEIPASQLIQMWIGEGFIQQNNDNDNDPSTLEEIAEKYLDDLINRNVARIDKFKLDGKVKTCRIHDTSRDFCRAEAENDNFFQEIKYNNGVFAPPVFDLNKYHRLSIHSNCLAFISSRPVGDRARSFVCFSKDEFFLPRENISDILAAFKLVRVLDVKPIKFPRFSIHMFRLVHARYIAMSLDFPTLPSKFSELQNIQTLIVDTTTLTLDVKANIWKMPQLRHFKTNAPAKLPKPSKDSKHGAELQTLGIISVESCTPQLFDRACNLKKLGICGRLALLLEGNTGSFDSLGKMKYLERLKLINDVYPLHASEVPLLGLPQHDQFPKRLRSLTLHATFLTWDYMSILGFLENLEVLKLKHNAFTGTTWNAVDGGFRKLVYLYIEHTDLAIWDDASSHHFPTLRGLVIKNCRKLLGIPLGLAHITTFQTLELYFSKSAVASATKIHKLKKEKGAEFKLSIVPPINYQS